MSGTENPRRHSRDDVARAALRILDDHGLAELTMRRLATALDVQPSALYWHFANKQTLLAELADRIVARAAIPTVDAATQPADPRPDDGPARIHAQAAALRDALLAYRDGAEVVASTLALGLGSTTAHDRLEAAIAAAGFDATTARRAATTLLHFTLGHVSHEQQRLQYDSLGVLADGAGAGAGSPLGDDDPAADYAFGVGLLVSGLERSRTQV